MRNIILLGASGSIGTSALEVILKFPSDYNLIAVASKNNYKRINEIIDKFKSIKKIYIEENSLLVNFSNIANNIEDIIKLDPSALVINAISGIEGLKATIIALKNNIDIGLANKESIVCGGDLIFDLIKKSKSKIYPIDSEHNAIYQCLKGEDKANIRNLILTCSGGPFNDYSLDQLENVKVEDALKHPTWSMGKKISIDSASLFNKGMEVIEARYLFDVEPSKIKTIVHKQSIIHSLVEFIDGNIKALLSNTTMQLPILYSLNDESRDKDINQYLDFDKFNTLTFSKPNIYLKPSIDLAYEVLNKGGIYTAVYAISDEIAVNYFLENKIKFLDIYKVVKYMVDSYKPKYTYELSNLFKEIENIKLIVIEYIDSIKGE